MKVQLFIPLAENWGNYWQVVYTVYPKNVKVKSLTYPFSEAENKEIRNLVVTWLHAERNLPEMPAKWPFERNMNIKAGEGAEIILNGTGIIRQLYISADPNVLEIWRNLRFIV